MGTNYYSKKLLLPEEKAVYHQAVEDSDFDLIEQFIAKDNEVHLCKLSCGWQALFDHNWGEFYQPTRESLDDFISEPGRIIVDEYGQQYTPEEFWQIIDNHNGSSRNIWTSKTYREWEKKEYPNRDFHDYAEENRDQCRNLFNVEPEGSDFQSGGLHWSVYTDFC